MKRFICVLSSVVIALSCFFLPVSAEEPPVGYEIGECVFDDEDFKQYMENQSHRIYLDESGYYYVNEDYSSEFVSLKNFCLDVVSPFYFVEYDLTSGGYLYLRFSKLIYPDTSLAPSMVRSGSGNGFTVLSGGLYPQVRISKKSSDLNYGIKSLRFYRVNLSGTAGLKSTKTAFGFVLGGAGNVIDIVVEHPVLVLGIALFCCGCAVAVYYRLRS